MAVKWEKVVQAAKELYNDRENYAYFYGAKAQVLTDDLMNALITAEPGHFAKYSAEQLRNIREFSRGRVGIDCSGFVCLTLERAGVINRAQWTYSTALIERCSPKMDPLQVPAAGILYRCPPGAGRHVGIDIDKGLFLHIGREGATIELGDNHSHFWEVGGCFPGIDYTGWSQGTERTAQARETMYVRSGPGITYPVVGEVVIGDTVKVISEDPNGWLRIRFGAGEAYTSNAGGRFYSFI